MAPCCQFFTTLLTGGLISAITASPVHADPPPPSAPAPKAVPTAELHALGGLGVAFEVAQMLFDHRLRIDAALRGLPSRGWMEDAASARFLGSPENGLWLRAGYMIQHFQYDHCSDYGGKTSDTPTTIDASLAYRKRWAGNSLLAVEAGVEQVWRDHLRCMDSGLGSGSGERLSVAGQWSITEHVGIYGRAGLRTGPHINEIGFLPELWLGLVVEN